MTAELIPMLAPDFGDLPSGIWAVQSTREGGVSAGPWQSLNLALHTGDDPEHVAENRYRLEHSLGVAAPVAWPRQVHGTRVVRAEDLLEAWEQGEVLEADAVFTDAPGVVCAVQTADCLPVVLATEDGEAVAVAHAGWRGLADGVLEAAVEALRITRPETEIRAWLGAAIGLEAFEIGPEVRDTFLEHDVGAAPAFRPGPNGHLHADLYALARHRLERVDVVRVAGGGRCTYTETERFYSYRRDGVTGRMGTLAWIGQLDDD